MITCKKDLNIDDLKKNYKKIHFFGLGFIQLKLNATERLHFYTSKLAPITSEEDVHNHRYNFTSTILEGEFSQDFFKIVPGNTHTLKKESCNPDIKVENALEVRCGLEFVESKSYKAGDTYTIIHDEFHRVRGKECITFIKRGPILKKAADVLYSDKSDRVCPFSLNISQKDLWEIIDIMLN